MGDCHAFSTRSSGRLIQLINEVSLAFGGNEVTVKALWDTGASSSCVSHDVVSDLGLTAIGKCMVSTPTGSKEVDTFCLDARLPNNVNFEGIVVMDSEIGNQGIGMLVGMDIIGQGDFAVSNHDGRTVFTYRYPSVGCIDFVNQLAVQRKIGPTHGKGKGKKK